MPTYTYLCGRQEDGTISETEGAEFDEYHSIMIVIEHCPICKKNGQEDHKPKRLISGGSGRSIVTLEGQDFVDKIKADTKKLRKDTYASEKRYANILGESKYQNLQSQMDKNKR